MCCVDTVLLLPMEWNVGWRKNSCRSNNIANYCSYFLSFIFDLLILPGVLSEEEPLYGCTKLSEKSTVLGHQNTLVLRRQKNFAFRQSPSKNRDLNSGPVFPESIPDPPKTASAGDGSGGLGVESVSSVVTKQGHVAQKTPSNFCT